jgi:hypothetical protein
MITSFSFFAAGRGRLRLPQPGSPRQPAPVSEFERFKIAFILCGPEVRESILRVLTEMSLSQ